jgi:O-acetyl-ADP-ribose deacetylase (regulator of RNase III)/uncharacterized protein YwgA
MPNTKQKVKVRVGDIFESHAQTLVNTVNCVGIMGKGVALEFKNRFPQMFQDYVRACERGEIQLGKPYLYKRTIEPWILNFPTKDHWRGVSRLSDIIAGLNFITQHYKQWGVTSLAVPPLGCGQGQLEWRVVGPTLFRHLSALEIPVELYAPHGTPADQLDLGFLNRAHKPTNAPEVKIQPSWVALVDIVARIEHEPYHWPVGRTIFQKIVYFATSLGLPTGIQHRQGSYGPFAESLKPLISKLVNNGLLEEHSLGKMFRIKPGPTFNDAKQSFAGELSKWDPILTKVADLFLRMHTNQAELAATVFFAANKIATAEAPSEADVLEEVKRWKQRRRPPLQEEDIARTIRNLNLLSWLHLRPSKELPVPPDMAFE